MSISTLNKFLIKNKDIGINVVYDIGANNGEWTQEHSKYLNKDTNFFLFEANEHYSDILKKNYKNSYIVLLSNEEKILNFYANNSTGDSYYKEANGNYDNIKPKLLKSKTLDSFCLENKIPDADLIKIDTQGSEIDILSGGLNVLLKCKLVLLEVSLIEYNLGAPKFQDYLDFMISNGFYPSYISQCYPINNKIIQADIIFANENIINNLFTSI